MTAQKFIPNLPDAGPKDGPSLARTVNWLIRRLNLLGTSGILLTDGDKGDITVSGVGTVWTIDNNVVTYAKMQDVSATSRFIGRITAGAGDPEELTGTQGTTLLDVFTAVLKGLAPASAGGTVNFLRADGTWAPPAGAGILTKGTATIDFGAFPGASDASVAVAGQAGILTTSYVEAHLLGVATADHSSDEHLVETIAVVPMDIVAGTGFTIKGVNTSSLFEPLSPLGGGANNNILAGGLVIEQGAQQSTAGGKGTRLYGTWNVAWAWSN